MQIAHSKKDIVFFDVDGPLVRGLMQESLIIFLMRTGVLSPFDFAKIMYGLARYKLGLLKDPRRLFELGIAYTNGRSIEDVHAICDRFLDQHLSTHLLHGGVKIIREHRSSGREVVLLSAIIEPLVRALGHRLEVAEVAGTPVEVIDGTCTGKLSGAITHGSGKVAAAERILTARSADWTDAWAYADHQSDLSLLEKVAHPFVVNAKPPMQRIARMRHWPVMSYTKIA